MPHRLLLLSSPSGLLCLADETAEVGILKAIVLPSLDCESTHHLSLRISQSKKMPDKSTQGLAALVSALVSTYRGSQNLLSAVKRRRWRSILNTLSAAKRVDDSLRRDVHALQSKYDKLYDTLGERFAIGDGML